MTFFCWLTSRICGVPVVLGNAARGARGFLDKLWRRHGAHTWKQNMGCIVGNSAVVLFLARSGMPRAGGLRLTKSEQDGGHEGSWCPVGTEERAGGKLSGDAQGAHRHDGLGSVCRSPGSLGSPQRPLHLQHPLHFHPVAQAGPCTHPHSQPACQVPWAGQKGGNSFALCHPWVGAGLHRPLCVPCAGEGVVA